MNLMMFILPAMAVVLLSLPLVKMFTSKVSKESAKWRLLTHVGGFFGAVALTLCLSMGSAFAAEGASIVGTVAQGMGFLAAALATGCSALGAGIAVAAAAPAAIGAFSENDNNFGKALIFVALGEGVAIYGLLISILIINNLA
ncbi:ATPase [Massilimicrobiota sp. An105]|uniref:ATP synthase subunit C n=1 Tax=Massilimicrobiota sp. An105 TaxID=1965540 RepID=UPI000B38396E|nr:ATP synthase subunit C [Massilimicrobiota sp. An105]OUQ74796.1 ATPase [Massilimicrobiota sp. An105]